MRVSDNMPKTFEEIIQEEEKVPMTVYVPKWIVNLTADIAEDCSDSTKTQVRSQVIEGAMRKIRDLTEKGYSPLQSTVIWNHKLNEEIKF